MLLKKIRIIAAILFVFTLTACGGDEDSTSSRGFVSIEKSIRDPGMRECLSLIEGVSENSTELRCEGINWFRSGVIWLRVEPDKSLISFQKKLCHQLRNTGIQLDSRKYIPHITLFRCKRKLQARQLEQVSKVFSGFSFSFTVDHLLLKKSQLTPEGAKHTVLTEFQPGSEGSNE